MLLSLLYLILAIVGLGFLIFIHELGHYWMARRRGMRVESFGIGFGRPIYSFKKDGVQWNICWLPFGGYVKIAGMEKENGQEPDQIKDGFFGKSPWDRIQVAIMGPLANILFAIAIFFVIWLTGGREKNFNEVTNKIGWLDPRSELYKSGIRPGDEIICYNNEPVHGGKDHFSAAMTGGLQLVAKGKKWDSAKGAYVPFAIDIHPYAHPQALEPGILTTGVLSPASYIIYGTQPNGSPNPLPAGSPLENSGIEYGDRIVWIDGLKVYSLAEVSYVLNDNRVLVTVKRGNNYLLRRVPRVQLEDLKLDSEHKEELTDWQWEAKLKDTKFQKLYFIPYNLNSDCLVESRLSFIDAEKQKETFLSSQFSEQDEPLEAGDVIVAIYGMPMKASFKLLQQLQTKKTLIAVAKMPEYNRSSPIDAASQDFDEVIHSKDLNMLVQSIGTPEEIQEKGAYKLLRPIIPKTRAELFQASDKSAQFSAEMEEERKHIQAIDDPEKRAQALKFLETREKQYLLGLPGVQDRPVTYNPNPFVMFSDVFESVVHTLGALFGGYLNPKWISGPIGIVQVIHNQWMAGVKEALFWIATISLNLGLINLLPLPVLDGGYICLSLYEMLTGKRLKSKTIEKIVIPFAIFLISFLIFLTYHDLVRIISGLLKW